MLVVLLTAALVTACGSADWSQPRQGPARIGSLGAGFSDPATTPAPESTITPAPGSWDDVHPPEGYRVVLLTAGDDAPTRTLADAVTGWADTEQVDLRTIDATGDQDLVPRVTEAIGMRPELIVTAGNDLVDPLTLVTASHLDQQFLVVGAEIGEPTANVTAVDWTGASYRGEGLEASSVYDPATFTEERGARAVRAGAAAVLSDLTGIVIWLS
ncbi:hypothetical protein KIH74_01540 [Kineosporia sp. J2-2]|uniref:BMP family ABC transporter substrate-binding protein n=1 Tax=Kineosporia corallincola TaxID=2835133 RepID=A0ABS5T937_9ACTN|nr:hypothetical protein [Kineosporia corallincola]MBT0767587.1 hypothetical protein [Kineosporia corallincola]